MKTSYIIAVLDSFDVVRKQLILLNNVLPKYKNDFEFILVSDGSDPLLITKIFEWNNKCFEFLEIIQEEHSKKWACDIYTIEGLGFPFKIVETYDHRPWTQPRARNIGADISNGEWLLMTDVDHIIEENGLNDSYNFNGDKMVFRRKFAILDDNGEVIRDHETLKEYGCQDKDLEVISSHANTFVMKKRIFCNLLKGYDHKFLGKYGNDDVDLNKRYGELFKDNKVNRHIVAESMMYVYPDPRKDVKNIFHDLRKRK
jgi:hypothetical protein